MPFNTLKLSKILNRHGGRGVCTIQTQFLNGVC